MTPQRVAAYASVAVVAVAIAVGLYISGPPGEQRERRMDERRLADLRQLAVAVETYYIETGELPAELERLVDGRRLSSIPLDPATDEPYELRVTGEKQFQLCAAFSRESPFAAAADFWSHGAGLECFDFDYSDRRRSPTVR